jgi:hypothetical protein
MAGRVYIYLDPEDYDRCEEPGWDRLLTGAQLAKLLNTQQGGTGYNAFWNPPGSNWLLPAPLHHRPGWYQDPRMFFHVVRRINWTFTSGVSVHEYELSRTPAGASYNNNQAVEVQVLATAAPFDSTDFAAMGAAANLAMPTTMRTIAFASETPTGHPLSGKADFHPFIKLIQYPEPYDWTVFGFSDLAFLVNGPALHILRSPDGTRQTWELLQSVKLGKGIDAPRAGIPDPSITPRQYQIAMHPVGLDHLFVDVFRGESALFALRDSDTGNPGLLFKTASWWWAAPTESAFGFQVQVVGYDRASTDDIQSGILAVGGTIPKMFSLGELYKPNEDPTINILRLMHPTDADLSNLTRITTPTSINEILNDDDEALEFALQDEAGIIWNSDGTHFEGSFVVTLEPGSTRYGAPYLAPQIKFVTVKFPVKRTTRATDPLLLDDTQFANLKVEMSLREPLGKRISFEVTEPDLGLLAFNGLDLREQYGVHVLRDDPGDADPLTMTVLARGWMHEAPLVELLTEASGTGPAPWRRYHLETHGLLQRLDQEWLFSPTIVNPDGGGEIEHDFAIKDALKKSGFDVTDTAFFTFHTDLYSGTEIARLPGTPDQLVGADGQDVDDPWAPDWSEHRIQYCQRVAREWRGWQFYEVGTKIRYHPDIITALLNGEPYFVSATIYRTHAEATTASVPGQCFEASPERYVNPMVCNSVRVTGKDPKGNKGDPDRPFHAIDKNTTSWTDLSNPADFLGEERVLTIVAKLAVGKGAAEQIARYLLRRLGRREQGWQIRVPIAPWQFSPNEVELGRVVKLKGTVKGDHLVTHLGWELLGRGTGASGTYVWRTTLTCEKLPPIDAAGNPVVASLTAGDYPGIGV